MYLFYASIIESDNFNKTTCQQWRKNFSSIMDPTINHLINFTHKIGFYNLRLSFIIPNHKNLMSIEDHSQNLTIYLLGDEGFLSPKKLFAQILSSYKSGRFDELTELPLLYNLIIIDHHLNKVFFLCDNYRSQTLFYHTFLKEYAVANTLKGIITHPNCTPQLDQEEIYNTLLIGTQFPEKTLIKNIKRIKHSHYLIYPDNILKKIIPTPSDKNHQLTVSDCVETIHQLSLESLQQWTNNKATGLLLSGGNDSTSVARLLQKHTDNNFFCLTYLAHQTDMNKLNIKDVYSLLNIKSQIINYDPETMIKQQEKAIWHAESDIIGLSSLNCSLEAALSQTISTHCEAWTCGDYYQMPIKLFFPSTKNFYNKYQFIFKNFIITPEEFEYLMQDSSYIKHLSTQLITRSHTMSNEEVVFEFYIPIYPSSIYRLRNRFTNFASSNFFLNRDYNLCQFMKTIPEQLLQQETRNHQGKITLIAHELLKKLLGEFYETRRKKAWMESFISSDINSGKNLEIKKEIKNRLYESSGLKQIFGNTLHALLNSEAKVGRYDNLLFCLWSLDIFHNQFITTKYQLQDAY